MVKPTKVCPKGGFKSMKALPVIIIISMLFAGVMAASAVGNILDLSTQGKKPQMEVVKLPRLTPYIPTYPVIDNTTPSGIVPLMLSTLGRKSALPVYEPRSLSGIRPITVTPSFSIKNGNVNTPGQITVFTLPHAIKPQRGDNASPAPTVYTPPIAIFGGA
jgi:hypothetical protein